MADIFVSYARSDEAHAAEVAGALKSAGYRVWRHDELPAHRRCQHLQRFSRDQRAR